MNRYFLAVSYLGAGYAGSQVQENAHTVQAELEAALAVFLRTRVELTGSSRTDAGVHARENYFHMDLETPIPAEAVYHVNAILPRDIALLRIIPVKPDAHCRFDALWREYWYHVYRRKDPFLEGRAFYYPYPLDEDALQEAAGVVRGYTDFTTFSKRNSQAKTFECRIDSSSWERVDNGWIYKVRANRFLRGMVRGLTGTMLHVGRGRWSMERLREVIESGDNRKADFSVPGHGLMLYGVGYDGQRILLEGDENRL